MAPAVPSQPGGPRPDYMARNPDIKTVVNPYTDGMFCDPEDAGAEFAAAPALRLDMAFVHANVADESGNAAFTSPDRFFDELFLGAAKRRVLTAEKVVAPGTLNDVVPVHRITVHRMMTDAVIEATGGAHFTACTPDYRRDEKFHAGVRGRSRKTPTSGRSGARPTSTCPKPNTRRSAARKGVSNDRRCDPRPAVKGRGVCGGLCRRLRRGGRVPGQPVRHGGRPRRPPGPPHFQPRPGPHRRRGRPHDGRTVAQHQAVGVRAGGRPSYRSVFDVVWSGRRHVMMMASQIDRYGNQNLSSIGDWRKPKAQLIGLPWGTRISTNHPTSYWVPDHNARTFVAQVDTVCGVGWDRAAAAGRAATRYHRVTQVVTNLCVLDFETPDHSMRIHSLHPGVTVDDVVAATGFELVVPDDVATTRLPTDEELGLIRDVLDPFGQRDAEVRS